MTRRLLLTAIVTTALAAGGCGSGKKGTSTSNVSAPTIPLTKQVLTAS